MENSSNIYVILIISVIIGLIMGKVFIPMLKRLHAGQSIREDGPQSHLVKEGTPTMGGVIFLSTLLLGTVIFKNFSMDSLMLLFATFAFGIVGFIDDYIKVVKKRNLGLTAKQKLLLQIVATLILIMYQYKSQDLNTDIYLPISKRMVNMGWLYIPFILFVVVGTVNSVNLTDGLDGLSSGVTFIVLIFFGIVALIKGRTGIFEFSLILAGGLLGFRHYNKYPAKVFMGDTGSLALGGAVAAIAVLMNMPLMLPIIGGVYFIETLSVIIQVVSFKTRGKRVFLMAPLHHHFEQKGWKEKKVVAVFCLIELVLFVISLQLIK